jgi:hypothetical protein
VAVFLLLFAPLDLHELRARRNVTLAHGNDVRAWVTAVRGFAQSAPALDAVVWTGSIPGFAPWGVEGAIHYLLPRDLPIVNGSAPEAAGLLQHARVAYIEWNPASRQATVIAHGPGISDLSYVDFSRAVPVWQLEQGWYDAEGDYRWTEPTAQARLARPDGARSFSLRVLVGPARLQALGPVTLRVWLNDRELEPHRFTKAGWQDTRWDLPPQAPGPVRMRLQADPPFHPSNDPRTLGIAVGAFGFR